MRAFPTSVLAVSPRLVRLALLGSVVAITVAPSFSVAVKPARTSVGTAVQANSCFASNGAAAVGTAAYRLSCNAPQLCADFAYALSDSATHAVAAPT